MQWCFAANSHTKKANLPAVTWPNNYLCIIKQHLRLMQWITNILN